MVPLRWILAAFFSAVPLLVMVLLLLLLLLGQEGVVVVVVVFVGGVTGDGWDRIKVFVCVFGEFVPGCCLTFGVGPTKRL